jgi:hypothetical protein
MDDFTELEFKFYNSVELYIVFIKLTEVVYLSIWNLLFFCLIIVSLG